MGLISLIHARARVIPLDACTACLLQVRKEAEQMLTSAIENRSREDLSAAVALATQLRLRSPQVRTWGEAREGRTRGGVGVVSQIVVQVHYKDCWCTCSREPLLRIPSRQCQQYWGRGMLANLAPRRQAVGSAT